MFQWNILDLAKVLTPANKLHTFKESSFTFSVSHCHVITPQNPKLNLKQEQTKSKREQLKERAREG